MEIENKSQDIYDVQTKDSVRTQCNDEHKPNRNGL